MTTRQRIEAWFKEEIELLIAKGATSQDLEEKAFEELLADNVSVRHFGEIQSDPELRKEIFGVTLRHAPPEILREFASKLRDAGHANRALCGHKWVAARMIWNSWPTSERGGMTTSVQDKLELQALRERAALLESLLSEALRENYIDEQRCSHSWLMEARRAVRR